MITFTQGYTRAAGMIGISPTTASQSLTNIKMDINQAVRMFKNASRRYWTRKEVVTNLVANQQYYTFPEDMVRITTVRVSTGSLSIPITIIDSEEKWNRLNLVPAMTVGIPTYGFIRGRNELGLYPLPAANQTNGLTVSYEARLKDMATDDIKPTVGVTVNSQTVTAATAVFAPNNVGMWFTVTDGSDGNWYQIVGVASDNKSITLENYYQGPTVASATALIGLAPDIPEDYHMAPIYFAAYNYFLTRKDAGMAANYKSLYEDLEKQYKSVYAAKTTGLVQDEVPTTAYNLFGLPPQNVTS